MTISWTYYVEQLQAANGTTAADAPFIAPKDLLIDTATGDLDLSGNAAHLAEGVDAIAQRLRIRLGFWKGEWFLDTDEGFPFIERVAGQKNPDLRLIERLYRRAILGCPGVEKIISFSTVLVTKTRTMNMRFRVKVASGETVRFDAAPYYVKAA